MRSERPLPLFQVLAISIPWSPNIVTLGGFVLTWHGLFTAIGILAGVQLALRMGRVVHYDPDDAYTLALVGVPSGIIGARALFIAEHWGYYRTAPLEILALNEGGISVWGAVIGGVLGAWLFARWRSYPVARALDIASFGIILGLAIGRLGDLVNGEHCATRSDLPWAVTYTNPISPGFVCEAHPAVNFLPVHPATTYEMLALLAILGGMFWLFAHPLRHRPALTFFVFLYAYCVVRFVFTYLRVDSDVVALGMRTPQLVAVLTAIAALPLAVYYLRQPQEADLSAPLPPGRVPVRRSGT
jgi:phosphatidylglycerol:prolipoprotein diacylglycerol transferase